MSEDRSPSVSPFRSLVTPEGWAELACHQPQTYLPGEQMLTQGTAGTCVLALVSGLVKVVRGDRDGRQRLLAFRGKGEILGEMALQCGGERLAHVWAISMCKVSVVPAEVFRRFIHKHQLAGPLAVMAAQRLIEQTEAHDGDVPERLALALLRLVEISEERSFALTREELAQHIGVGRKAVSRALEQMGPGQVIAEKGRIEVIDLKKLRKTIAGEPDDPA